MEAYDEDKSARQGLFGALKKMGPAPGLPPALAQPGPEPLSPARFALKGKPIDNQPAYDAEERAAAEWRAAVSPSKRWGGAPDPQVL